jgi:hypothetical protein
MFRWLRRKAEAPSGGTVRGGTIAFDVTQKGNRIEIRGDGIDIFFAVDGDVALPAEVDATFAVWALLPRAMEEGFNIHINRPIDPRVAANAESVSQIWEMWLPNRYRSVDITGKGEWRRTPRERLPEVRLYSGGVDSTFSIMQDRDAKHRGFVATIAKFDKVGTSNIARLIAKTDPLLRELNYERILIDNNLTHRHFHLTNGLTLASCLFLLSDVFEPGTLAADSTKAMDMAEWPWGNNHITNSYFAGSDFTVRTVGADVGRIEKIETIAKAGLDPQFLSFCRGAVAPANCGTCRKCVRTKAMFLIVTGRIPEIFIDNALDDRLMQQMIRPRTELFDLYFYARRHGRLDRIPSLLRLVEEWRTGRSKATLLPYR